MEKTDAQIQFLSGGYVPTADNGGMEVGDNLRSGKDIEAEEEKTKVI